MTLKLESPSSRILVILATAAIAFLLVRINIAHFVARVIADQRVAMDREALGAAAQKYPDSARIRFKLAEAEIAGGGDSANALRYARAAVNLSPWDYQARRLLAMAEEMNGLQREAEDSIRTTLRLAPYHGELNWAVANILLRGGKIQDSLAHFRIASRSTPDLLPQTLDLIWIASGGDLEAMRALTEPEPEMQLSLVRFLVEQNRIPDAVRMFNLIEAKTRLESGRSAEFLQSLLAARQYEMAREVWLGLANSLTGSRTSAAGAIWNPGFELDTLPLFPHFDWVMQPNEYARIGFDRSETRGGLRSLRMLFAGKDTTLINGQVRQMVLLRPGARYRLECYVKSTDLVTPEGPRLAIAGEQGMIASSAPVAEGSSGWERLTVDFVCPNTETPKYVTIVRIPRFSYDDPTKGAVWFDDFSLTETP
ncbi:MAG: tetratricopeptide repeat protein [Blastocatellia bacterium]